MREQRAKTQVKKKKQKQKLQDNTRLGVTTSFLLSL